jgi:Domain of unknown function (DUF4271)
MKLFFAFLSIFLFFQTVVFAQPDASPAGSTSTRHNSVLNHRYYKGLDSALVARNKAIKDSLKNIGDSLSLIWIKAPDPKRPNKFLDNFIAMYKIKELDFISWTKRFPKKINEYNKGRLKAKGESWIIAVILFLILLFAIIKNAFSKELVSVLQSFYSNRVLGQINKEDNLFSSWPFIFLYLLFGLTIGMCLYLSKQYFGLEYQFRGLEWFLILSVIVIGLFTFKIIILRSLGFFFGMQRLVKDYVSILYLTYFNVAILFLPLIIAFSLTPSPYNEVYIYISVLLLLIIFLGQFLRAGSNILSNYQFPKVYLFIYLCALEICPLLILIKVLKF